MPWYRLFPSLRITFADWISSTAILFMEVLENLCSVRLTVWVHNPRLSIMYHNGSAMRTNCLPAMPWTVTRGQRPSLAVLPLRRPNSVFFSSPRMAWGSCLPSTRPQAAMQSPSRSLIWSNYQCERTGRAHPAHALITLSANGRLRVHAEMAKRITCAQAALSQCLNWNQ